MKRHVEKEKVLVIHMMGDNGWEVHTCLQAEEREHI